MKIYLVTGTIEVVKSPIKYPGDLESRRIHSHVSNLRVQARCTEEADTLTLYREARLLGTQYWLDRSVKPRWLDDLVIEDTGEVVRPVMAQATTQMMFDLSEGG